MRLVTLSPKYQIQIPRDIAERLRLSPGEQLQVFVYDDRIELIPAAPVESKRGFLAGIDTRVPRDTDSA